jgi:hypothetical protein
MVVFTQYDRLVWTKKDELKEEDDSLDEEALNRQGHKDAKGAFENSVRSVMNTMTHLNIDPPPPCIAVSGTSCPC